MSVFYWTRACIVEHQIFIHDPARFNVKGLRDILKRPVHINVPLHVTFDLNI